MNIKIIICFMIIILFPPLSAGAQDKVWAAKCSGFIEQNSSLAFENLIIKSKVIDDSKALITVYKDDYTSEQENFYINEYRDYGNIRVTLLGINGIYSWIAISRQESKNIWVPAGSKLLKWGETYEIDNHTISPEAFGPEYVNLTISYMNSTWEKTFAKNDSEDSGNLRIIVRNINETGIVELDFLALPVQNIVADISTDKDEYTPDDTVELSVNITGGTAWNIAGIFLYTEPGTVMQPAMFSSTGVAGIQNFSSKITQLVPNSNITITALIKMRDYNNNEYSTRISKVIRTLPVMSIIKKVPRETDEKEVPVILYIHNAGQTEETISVYDFVYENETLNPGQLSWVVKLKPGSSTNITYNTVPQKRGLYVFPPATAKWKNQSSTSKEITMMAHGPYIEMTKSSTRKSGITGVKLIVKNSGDRPAQVEVSDTLPDGYPLAGGETKWSGFLEGGESATINYALQGDAVPLPAAHATYRDVHGVTRQADSDTGEIAVQETISGNVSKNMENEVNNEEVMKGDASPLNAGPNDLLLFMVSSFIAIAGIISGAALIACLSIKKSG
ncbi:MAG TPA: hypothetical protein VIO11_03640 [Candidatus Methanoperedens sp.]